MLGFLLPSLYLGTIFFLGLLFCSIYMILKQRIRIVGKYEIHGKLVLALGILLLPVAISPVITNFLSPWSNYFVTICFGMFIVLSIYSFFVAKKAGE